jgi:hypothetical protein
LWLAVLNPAGSLAALPGRQTLINGHVAWVDWAAFDGGCPDGAAQELRAYVRIATKPYGPDHYLPGGHIDMTACLGANASPEDHAAVTTMLHSLRINTEFWY